ncbi:MAG TPA: ParB/RepB/Spo0J family partition protein [Chloroflexia bacterium]|nr:ParB/RepB/Spo0J family partition protein [Chloroflexia bacterium]
MKDEVIQKSEEVLANQKSKPKDSLFSSPKAKAVLQGRVETNRVATSQVQRADKNATSKKQTIGVTQMEAAPIEVAERELALQFIPINAIDPNPFYNMGFSQIAKEENIEDSRKWLVEKLAQLFRNGQMDEFVALVRSHPDNPQRFQLAYGHLRVKAASIAGLSKIPAVIKSLSDDEMLMRLVLENQNRVNPSRVEMAAQVRHLREQSALSFKALGKLFNLPLATVYDLFYLSMAPSKFLQFVEKQPQYYQAISEMIRRKLPYEAQEQIWEFLNSGKVSPRQTRDKARELLLVNQKDRNQE